MKRRDDGKASLVDFLKSIKFSTRKKKNHTEECETHFAALDPQARPAKDNNNDDASLERSAN